MTATEHVTPLAWMDSAACAELGYGDLWYPLPGGLSDEAIAICETCPVLKTCLDWAMAMEEDVGRNYRHGVSGGWTARQRHDRTRIRNDHDYRA